MSTKDLFDANPLALSFIGDAVHTLFIRSAMLPRDAYRNGALHSLSSDFACAPSQAEDAKKMLPLLTDEERRIFNKGKHAKIHTVPKHATFYQYQLATAFEAVTGFLYLAGRNDRLAELYEIIYADRISENKDKDTQNLVNKNDGEAEE